MSIPQKLPVLALASALLAPGPSHAELPAASDATLCFVPNERIASVKPYFGKHELGRAALQPLRGAELQLAPSSLFDTDWLESRLQRVLDAREHAPLPACLRDVGRVHIEPDRFGDGLTVKFIARDPADAQQVLARIRRLLGP